MSPPVLTGQAIDTLLAHHGLRATRVRLVAQLDCEIHRIALARPHGLAGQRVADPRLPATTHAVLAAAARWLLALRKGWCQDPRNHGWVHGDLHLWNLLFHGRQAGAIDFSDAGFGLHAQDLASCLQYLRHPWVGNHDHGTRLAVMQAQLLEGYARWRPLPPGVQGQIDVCVAIRMVNTVEWMLDQWPRLDWRPWGPGFLQRVAASLARWTG